MTDYNINNIKNDIQNLQDQNSYDFQEIKRLDRLINEYDKRVSQAINMNNQINKKIQVDYEIFKKTIIDDLYALIKNNGNVSDSNGSGNEYTQSCTSEYILDKMYPMGQSHEAIPSGLITDTWKYNTRWENQNRPTAIAHNCNQSGCPGTGLFKALGCWSNVYRVEGTPFTQNTGVEMKDIKVYGWYNGKWELVQHLPVPNGNFYAESFGGDASKYFADSVKETSTSKTIILREKNKIDAMNWNTGQLQTENCMYHPFSDVNYFDTKYEYIYTCIDLRKVKWDENGIDDRDSTHYCSNCGGDWWLAEGLTFHDSWQHNKGVCQPKMIEITNEWRRFSMTTVPQNWQYGFPKNDDNLDIGNGGGGGTELTPAQLNNISKIPTIQNTIDNLPNAYASKTHTHSNYAKASHRHDASEIDNLPTGGTGGTGGTGAGVSVIDNLTSTSTTSALSANQGRNLKQQLDSLSLASGTTLQYAGKKMECLGDSITARGVYQELIKSKLGFSEVLNHGIGGTCISGTGVNAFWQDVRINALDTTADVVLLTGGTNDWQQNLTLGDINSTETNTFYGACKYVIEKLITLYPNKLIIVATPIWGKSPSSLVNNAGKNQQGYELGDYAKALKECAELYCIPVADVYHDCGFNNINKNYYFGDKDGTILDDFIHPNSLYGHPKIANCICAKLKTLDVVGTGSETYGRLVVSDTHFDVNEGDTNISFTITLDTAPTGNQSVSISSNNSDIKLSKSSLIFNSTNYNTPQTVTFNIAEDGDITDESSVITISTLGSSATITVNITDNDETESVIKPGDNLITSNSKIVYRSGKTQSGASITNGDFVMNIDSGNMCGIVVPITPGKQYTLSYGTKTGIHADHQPMYNFYSAEPTYVQHDEPSLISYNTFIGNRTSQTVTAPQTATYIGLACYANTSGEGSFTAVSIKEVVE